MKTKLNSTEAFGIRGKGIPISSLSYAIALMLLMFAEHEALAQAPGFKDSPTNTPLASWSFQDPTNWTSDQGFTPMSFTNLAFSYLGDGASLVVEGCAPFPEDRLPDGGSGGVARVVPDDFGTDWTAEIGNCDVRMKADHLKTTATTEVVSSHPGETIHWRQNCRRNIARAVEKPVAD